MINIHNNKNIYIIVDIQLVQKNICEMVWFISFVRNSASQKNQKSCPKSLKQQNCNRCS